MDIKNVIDITNKLNEFLLNSQLLYDSFTTYKSIQKDLSNRDYLEKEHYIEFRIPMQDQVKRGPDESIYFILDTILDSQDYSATGKPIKYLRVNMIAYVTSKLLYAKTNRLNLVNAFVNEIDRFKKENKLDMNVTSICHVMLSDDLPAYRVNFNFSIK